MINFSRSISKFFNLLSFIVIFIALCGASVACSFGADNDVQLEDEEDDDNDNDNDNDDDNDNDSDEIDDDEFVAKAPLIPDENCELLRSSLKERLLVMAERAIRIVRYRMEEKVETGCNYSEDIIIIDGAVEPEFDNLFDDDEADDSSSTNTQEEDVDEADFVKNDAGHIYILADGKFQVIDAWPAEQSHIIGSLEIQGTPKKMYVKDGRAVVYSSLGFVGSGNEIPAQIEQAEGDYLFHETECTYGYDCEFIGDERVLKMTMVDLTDNTQPVVTREVLFSGSYLNSRRIGDTVHTVVTFPNPTSIDGLGVFPKELLPYRFTCWDNPGDVPFTLKDVNAGFDRLLDELETRVDQALDGDMTQFLPRIRDSLNLDDSTPFGDKPLFGCNNLYVSSTPDGNSYLGLASFNMADNGDFGGSIIRSKPGTVYASSDSLYVAARHTKNEFDQWLYDDEPENAMATSVHKFALQSESASSVYQGSGVVKGHILNQFSLSEHNSDLRIATTIGKAFQDFANSSVTVLRKKDNKLVAVGRVGNIAPSEDIRSVRYNGDVAFVVTFKKTDPLFVIDLSDPTHPAIKGELKIPGFSTYMHLMDEDHLLTIGYDTNDQGSFAWFEGIQLQIIDVSDLSKPQLIHKEVIGTRGSTSEATTNHLAFNYYPTRDYLALPMMICLDSEGEGDFGMKMDFDGLMVFDVNTSSGFDELGRVSHVDAEEAFSDESVCHNWWTDSNSKVLRSVFMENFVYSVAKDKINIADVTDLENQLVTIVLQESE